MSAAYYHKKRTPQFNRLIDDLQKKKQDRSRTTEERLREATERQEKLGQSIKLLTERNQTDAADKLWEQGYVDWSLCHDAVTEDDIQKWAEWRKRTPASIETFVEARLYGSYGGLFCLPIHDTLTQRVIGIHYHATDLTSNDWFIYPRGTPQQPLIIGDYTTAPLVIVGESNWDLDRISSLFTEWKIDPTGWCTICTRGAGHASLCPVDLNPEATILALPHRDYHGEVWLADLGVHLRRSLHVLQSTASKRIGKDQIILCKDVDDWFREYDCTAAELEQAIHSATDRPPELPRLILPSSLVPYDRTAEDMYHLLASTKKFFIRNRELVGLRSNMPTGDGDNPPSDYLHPATPTSLCTDIEPYMAPYKWMTINGWSGFVKKQLTSQTATYLLQSQALIRKSLPLRLITTNPVLIDDNGEPRLLGKGYHPEVGGLLVERDIQPVKMSLEEAVLVLTDGIPQKDGSRRGGLFANYNFVTPSDYSRAISMVVSPMLKLGSILPRNVDYPLDLAIADQSQSGKSHRMRITALVYGEVAHPVVKKEGGVGSLDETLATALCAGRLFVLIDKVRGLMDSQLFESYLRGNGTVSVRLPYRQSVPIETGQSLIQLTSNAAEMRRDLANRSIFTNIRKAASNAPRPLPFGPAQLDYIKANQSLYLGALVNVVSEYIRRGKPRTKETGHAFEEWVRSLDWIVQHIFERPPLMEHHKALQDVSSNENLSFMRVWALAVVRHGKAKFSYRASDIINQCIEYNITIPRVRLESLSINERAVQSSLGCTMAAVFGAAGQGVSERVHRVLIEDVVIFRTISKSVVSNHDDKWYTVFASSEAPDTLANPIFDPEVREEQDYAAANTPRPLICK